jgi:hypothetical protein
MTNTPDAESPASWGTPVWHSDWGDAGAELETLRGLATLLLRRAGDRFRVSLDAPEPGYMSVEVWRKAPPARVADVYVVEGANGERLALFLDEHDGEGELYFSDEVSVVDRICELS